MPQRAVHCLILLMLAFAWPSAAGATEPVLLPTAGPALERLFAETRGVWTLPDAQIQPHRLTGHACAANGACADFLLTPPSPGCTHALVPAGCLQVTPPTPALQQVLTGLGDPWQRLPDAPTQAPPVLWPWLLAWGLVPVLLAFAASIRRTRSWALALIGGLAWPSLFLLGSVFGAWWPLWDALGMGTLTAFVWALRTAPSRPSGRGLALSALVLVLGLGALELSLRVFGRQQAPVLAPSQPPLHVNGDVLTRLRVNEPGFCPLWGPPLGEAVDCPPGPAVPTQHPAVLHIGDSLLQAPGLPRTQTVTAWLEKLLPGSAHVNTGVGATSLDLQALIAQRWLARTRFDALVFHVYPCNDLGEIGEPRLYCGDAPVLVDDRGVTKARCPQPRAEQPKLTTLLRYSPPPFPLQFLAADLRLAGVGVRLFAAFARALRPATEETGRDAAHQYTQALRFLLAQSKARQLPVAAVVMPMRATACSAGNVADAQVLRRILKDAQIPVWDSQPLFDDATRTQGESAVFGEMPPGDPHLNPHGLEELGRWLAPQVQTWLATHN